MSMPLRLRTAVRAFKTKASTAASKAASKKDATGGRDPYGLFKEAIASDFPDAVSTPMAYEEWKEHRASYSRVKMHEHQRINGHLTKMIRLREAAINELPEALQQEARQPDHTLLPIQRRIFTETAPIPDFQLKLQRATNSE